MNGDDALLPVVRQVDGLGALEDAVSIPWVNFFHDVCPRLQARPEGHAVGAGGTLPDDSSASAGGAAQVAELEGGPTQGLAGNTVRFVHHDSVERDIFKRQRFALPSLNVDLLGGGFLDGETVGRLQLRHLVPAVPQALQHDLAALVGKVGPQVVQLAGGGAVGAVPHLELGSLDGAAGDAVHFVDGESGFLVVLKIYRPVPVGIEGDQLGLRVHQIRGRHRLFGDFVHAG